MCKPRVKPEKKAILGMMIIIQLGYLKVFERVMGRVHKLDLLLLKASSHGSCAGTQPAICQTYVTCKNADTMNVCSGFETFRLYATVTYKNSV